MKHLLLMHVVVSLLLGAACSRASPPELETLYGFELAEFEGIPPTDVAVRIEPAVEKSDLVQTTSQLVADALRGCGTLVREPGALDAPHGLEFISRSGSLVSAASANQRLPLAMCLLSGIEGKVLKDLGSGERHLTIQVRRHYRAP